MENADRTTKPRMLLGWAAFCFVVLWLAGCVTAAQLTTPAQMMTMGTAIVTSTPDTPLPTPTPISITSTPETAASNCIEIPRIIEQSCTSASTGLRYWLYLPPTGAVGEKPPLLIYLHGFSDSGSDLDRVLTGGLPAQIENRRALPMIVVSPQCPSGRNWQTEAMVEELSLFVQEVVVQHGADPERVYLTGFSMGGDGVWALGIAHPEQFAALAPVGSWYRNEKAVCSLKDVPVWDFQGEQDQIVSPEYAKRMTAALQGCGGTVKLTLFPDADHEGSSRQAYGLDELYTWLLEQK